MDTHAKIVAALKGGDRASALVEIDHLLAASPEDADLLGLRGLALAMSGRIREAADSVRQAVNRSVEPSQRLKHAGNLARLLANAGRRHELANLPQLDLPRLGGMADAALDLAALENLCAPLLAAGQHDFVAHYLEPVLDRPSATWPVERLWLRATQASGRHGALLARVTAPGYRWGGESEALALACAAALEDRREAQAGHLLAAYVAAAPPYAAPRRETQLLSVVLISPNPHPETLAYSVEGQHFSANFPSQIALARADRYRFLSVFADGPPRPLAGEVVAGEHAVVLNNCVNAEDLKRGDLARVLAHEQALALPVINSAQQAVHCTRVETAETLRSVPGLVVPKAMRFKLDGSMLPALRKRIKELFALPVILRSVGEQRSANIHLAATDAELDATLGALLAAGNRDIYAIEYAGAVHDNGRFRRLRAAFVGGTPLLIRADYDGQWIVNSRRHERIRDNYRRDPALLAEANGLVENPEQLGASAWAALAEIGRRIPLDVFGLDFDVDGEGRAVFFEANATMNLLSLAPPEFAYPPGAQQAFLKALDGLLLKRAGIALQ